MLIITQNIILKILMNSKLRSLNSILVHICYDKSNQIDQYSYKHCVSIKLVLNY